MTKTYWIYADGFGELRHYDYELIVKPSSWKFLGAIAIAS